MPRLDVARGLSGGLLQVLRFDHQDHGVGLAQPFGRSRGKVVTPVSLLSKSRADCSGSQTEIISGPQIRD